MSQEYTELKTFALKKRTGYRLLLEGFLLIIAVFAIYLIIALLTFDSADPSWSQTAWHEPIHNAGGRMGAWLADVFLFSCGVVAYLLPIIMLILCWHFAQQFYRVEQPDYFTLAIKVIGAVALILSSCALAAMNVNDWYYFSSGGVLGSLLNSFMVNQFNHIGATLLSLAIWGAGFSLFTSWSWLTIVEKIGWVTLSLFERLTNIFNRSSAKQETVQVAQQHNTAFHQNIVQITPNAHGSDLLTVYPSMPSDESADGQRVTLADADLCLKQFKQVDEPEVSLSDDSAALSDVVVRMNKDSSDANQIPVFNQTAEVSVDSVTNNTGQRLSSTGAFMPYVDTELLTIDDPKEMMHTMVIGDQTSATEKRVSIRLATGNEIKERRKANQTLPRPNPVRIPTRRELLAYGIQLPSQRQQEDELSPPSLNDDNNITIHGGSVYPSVAASYDDDDFSYDKNMMLDDILSQHEKYQHEQDVDLMPHTFRPESAPPAQYQQDVVAEPLIVDEHRGMNTREDFDINQSLIHPFLMRNDQILPKPTTPLPTLNLLSPPPLSKQPVNMAALQHQAKLLEARLMDYRVKAHVVGIHPGPVITLFELDLAPGVKAARISNLARDLARSLSAVAVRVVEVLPGRPYVGLELPNEHRQTVYLREVLDCEQFRKMSSPLAIVLGQDISGKPVVADLAKMPHVLVAGTTGSGKSVGVNAMIISMLYKATPDDVRFIMIDPKMLELSVYEGIPHLLTEVVTDMKDAANALNWCVGEMERRYKLMSALGVRNLAGYNERIIQAETMGRPIPDPFWKPGTTMDPYPPHLEKLPYIVVIVDEFADLMMAVGKKVEELIARLAQKARAAGIHLVLATQRPSVDVITGLIKANIPTRIAFTVSSKIDSRTILDQGGAESLLGMGDMLYLPPNSSMPVRVHGAFVRDEEVHAVAQDWKARGKPKYIENITATVEDSSSSGGSDSAEDLDPLYDSAVAFVVEKRKASISAVQRQFRIGYNRAARIIEQMEAEGTVSPPGHNGNREVLAPPPFD